MLSQILILLSFNSLVFRYTIKGYTRILGCRIAPQNALLVSHILVTSRVNNTSESNKIKSVFKLLYRYCIERACLYEPKVEPCFSCSSILLVM